MKIIICNPNPNDTATTIEMLQVLRGIKETFLKCVWVSEALSLVPENDPYVLIVDSGVASGLDLDIGEEKPSDFLARAAKEKNPRGKVIFNGVPELDRSTWEHKKIIHFLTSL